MWHGEGEWRVGDLLQVGRRIEAELDGQAYALAAALFSRLKLIVLMYVVGALALVGLLLVREMWWGVMMHVCGLAALYRTLQVSCREGSALPSPQAAGWYLSRERWMFYPPVAAMLLCGLVGMPLQVFVLAGAIVTYVSVAVALFVHLTPVLSLLRPPFRGVSALRLCPVLVPVR